MKRFILILCLPLLSFAHPHMYVDVDITLSLKNKQIQTANIAWTFDDMNSQILLMDYDKNGDTKFDKKETLFFKSEVFDKLGEYEYYTHILIDDKKIPIDKRNSHFHLTFEKNRFIVHYTVSLVDIEQKKSVVFGFWDKDFFSSFDIASKDVHFQGGELPIMIDEVEDDIYMGVVLKLSL